MKYQITFGQIPCVTRQFTPGPELEEFLERHPDLVHIMAYLIGNSRNRTVRMDAIAIVNMINALEVRQSIVMERLKELEEREVISIVNETIFIDREYLEEA